MECPFLFDILKIKRKDIMNYVEPIRDKNKLEDILKYLKKTNLRNFILFCIGIYTGLRISDILKLQVKHVRGKESIRMKEQKTGKGKVIKINKVLKKELEDYINGKEEYEYLIANSSTGMNPISRQHAYKIVKDTCNTFGIENVGTHSLRKTFGYHYYNATKDTAVLQNIFNHSDPSITLRYIGINQDTISDAYESMRYF
ncbi:site-specific integrase [Peptostreptococcus sp. D1]|uniref:site-specific integrase n=1 Tax=Peptostreptococcus sp. D1 TaxID=72304 RepID=UPI002E8E2760|nr:site-specific integrase [Peptostreptococcus sp. D1]